MTTKETRDIAYENGLDLIETTSERNGYPSNLKFAIIGFEDFDEAKSLADTYGLSIEYFQRRDGWQLWYRTGNTAYEPFTREASDYGDDYSLLDKEDIDTFQINEIDPFIEDYEGEELEDFLREKDEILNELKKMDDSEAVITCQGRYYDTIQRVCMEYEEDTRHYAIGLIKR